ncbi:hypothetical protein DFS34DRAFT_614778 [Phlyctochytrium arcticum]|nr:hypothetical protein DFS34DRAFT_614778 [Phlyctochytrium arcticum]
MSSTDGFEGHDDAARKRGVGNLAKLFESNVPDTTKGSHSRAVGDTSGSHIADKQSIHRGHTHHVFHKAAPPAGHRMSVVGNTRLSGSPYGSAGSISSPHSSSSSLHSDSGSHPVPTSKRTSVYERAGVPPPMTVKSGGATWGHSSQSPPLARPRHPAGSSGDGNATDSPSGQRRISVTRLSQFFEHAIDDLKPHSTPHHHISPALRHLGGISRSSTIAKAGSTSHLPEPSYFGSSSAQPPSSLRDTHSSHGNLSQTRQTNGSTLPSGYMSVDHLPRPAVTHSRPNSVATLGDSRPLSTASIGENPFLSESEKPPSRNATIDIPDTLSVSQRLSAISKTNTVKSPPRDTTVPPSSYASPSATSPAGKSPVPPPALPGSPSFKRARPPIGANIAALQQKTSNMILGLAPPLPAGGVSYSQSSPNLTQNPIMVMPGAGLSRQDTAKSPVRTDKPDTPTTPQPSSPGPRQPPLKPHPRPPPSISPVQRTPSTTRPSTPSDPFRTHTPTPHATPNLLATTNLGFSTPMSGMSPLPPMSIPSTVPSPAPSSANGDLDPAAAKAKMEKKRNKIVEEVVDTERAFLKDMEILMEIYAIPASERGILPPQDLKHLFGNLDVVIDVSRALLELVEAAQGSEDQWIGEAFNQMMRKVEMAYCDYCKHNEAAMAKLAEFASPECPPTVKEFLKECQLKLQGRTGAWDLGSLVIKPVQRVLKYPLLVKQLLKETLPSHPDYEQLVKAAEDIETVAEKINEVKKRKDLVEKYVDGKGNVNMIHGITKKWTRGTQQLKRATGMVENSTTSDALYEALTEKFDQQHQSVQQLREDLLAWLSKTRQLFDFQEGLATALADLYLRDRADTPHISADDFFVVQEFQRACVRHTVSTWRDTDQSVKNQLLPALDSLLKRFKDPLVVMRKREKKLLDFERATAIRSRGEPVDKALNDSAEAYSSLHGQLVEELPMFLDLVAKYVDVVAVGVADIQAQVYERLVAEFDPVVKLISGKNGATNGDAINVIGEYMRAMRVGEPCELAARELRLLGGWRNEVWGGLSPGANGLSDGDGGTPSRPRSRTVGTPGAIQDELRKTFFPPGSIASLNGSSGGLNSNYGYSNGVGPTQRSSPDVLMGGHPRSASEQPAGYHPHSLRPSNGNLTPTPSAPTTTSAPPSFPLPSLPPTDSPASAPESSGYLALAAYDFTATNPDELDLAAGDVVRVLMDGRTAGSSSSDLQTFPFSDASLGGAGDAWWFGVRERDGVQGWFPGAYLMMDGDERD